MTYPALPKSGNAGVRIGVSGAWLILGLVVGVAVVTALDFLLVGFVLAPEYLREFVNDIPVFFLTLAGADDVFIQANVFLVADPGLILFDLAFDILVGHADLLSPGFDCSRL